MGEPMPNFDVMAMRVRYGCCENRRTPCSYHEGWWDGLEAGSHATLPAIERLTASNASLVEERDRLRRVLADINHDPVAPHAT